MSLFRSMRLTNVVRALAKTCKTIAPFGNVNVSKPSVAQTSVKPCTFRLAVAREKVFTGNARRARSSHSGARFVWKSEERKRTNRIWSAPLVQSGRTSCRTTFTVWLLRKPRPERLPERFRYPFPPLVSTRFSSGRRTGCVQRRTSTSTGTVFKRYTFVRTPKL